MATTDADLRHRVGEIDLHVPQLGQDDVPALCLELYLSFAPAALEEGLLSGANKFSLCVEEMTW